MSDATRHTVAQVMAKLAKLPPDLVVYLSTDSDWYPVTEVGVQDDVGYRYVEVR